MREYKSGKWGFHLIWGIKASAFPRALMMAIPNAALAFMLATVTGQHTAESQAQADDAFALWAGFSSVLFWVLYFRSSVAYNRWWEGGTLLQQTRGEWFNSYSSLIAFTSADPDREDDVEAYQHMLARLMSLLFCSALQQVSPDRDRPFEILDSWGIEPKSLQFLWESNDRVEVILQWIQRSTVMNMSTGVLPIPPPVMSRAFQEISRGIVNLQNARKIADFPFPWPWAQASMVMLLIHWAMCPVVASILLNRELAAASCFVVTFFLWCMNFVALEIESPFGTEPNDLPLMQMQVDWNKSVATLLAKRANQAPCFEFRPDKHRRLEVTMSDGSVPTSGCRLSVARHVVTQHMGRWSADSAAVSVSGEDGMFGRLTKQSSSAERVSSARESRQTLHRKRDPRDSCNGLNKKGTSISEGAESVKKGIGVNHPEAQGVCNQEDARSSGEILSAGDGITATMTEHPDERHSKLAPGLNVAAVRRARDILASELLQEDHEAAGHAAGVQSRRRSSGIAVIIPPEVLSEAAEASADVSSAQQSAAEAGGIADSVPLESLGERRIHNLNLSKGSDNAHSAPSQDGGEEGAGSAGLSL